MWVYVCVYAHTHTHCTDGVLDVSPGAGMMRHLESPKNPDGLNLGIHIFVYVYKVHMCMYMLGGDLRLTIFSPNIFFSRERKSKDVNTNHR